METKKQVCDWCTKEAEAVGEDGTFVCSQGGPDGVIFGHGNRGVRYSPLWMREAEESGEGVDAAEKRLFPKNKPDVRVVDLFDTDGQYIISGMVDYWRGAPSTVFIGAGHGTCYRLSKRVDGRRGVYVACTLEKLVGQHEKPKGTVPPLNEHNA